MKHPTSRRSFLQIMGAGMTAATLERAWAADPQKLDPKDPAAVALAYLENAQKVDRKKYPAYVPDTNCANCLQLQGKEGNDYRPCSLFPGKLVAVAGWCSGWTAEM